MLQIGCGEPNPDVVGCVCGQIGSTVLLIICDLNVGMFPLPILLCISYLKLWSIVFKTFCVEHHFALSARDKKWNEFQCYGQLQVFWGVMLWL